MNISVLTLHQFISSKSSYDNTFVFQGEDISKTILDLIFNRSQFVFLSANPDLSIGDLSIYDYKPVLREDDISNKLAVRKFELHICHKLTTQICIAKKLITSNIFEQKSKLSKTYTPVRICKAKNNVEEVKYIQTQTNRFLNNSYEVSVLFKSREDIVSYFNTILKCDGKQIWTIVKDRFDNIDMCSLELYLNEHGYNYILSPYSELEKDAVYVMTYEEVKGMIFDYVILPFFDNQLCIEAEMRLINKLMIHSIMSARSGVYFTYSYHPNEFLKQIDSECVQIIIDNEKTDTRFNIFGI